MSQLPPKPGSLQKTKPAKDKKYRAHISSMPCLLAGPNCRGIVAPHHVRNAGMSRKCSDYLTVPLCFRHHRELDDPGGSKKIFEAKYGVDLKAIAKHHRERYGQA